MKHAPHTLFVQSPLQPFVSERLDPLPVAPGAAKPEPLTVRNRVLALRSLRGGGWPACAGREPAWPNARCATLAIFAGWGPTRWLPERCLRRPGTAPPTAPDLLVLAE